MSEPQASVIIPTRDRCADLDRALQAWERQTPEGFSFEVVVVDDGSTDGTAEYLSERVSRRYRLKWARQDPCGPALARNRALDLASGAVVLFTGDDIEPAPSLLAEHLRVHRELSDPGAAVLGLTRWPDGAGLTATMRHIDGVGGQQFSYQGMRDGGWYDYRHFYTSNLSVQRELLECEPDGFSPDFPAAAFEDAEFAYRLSRHGMRIRYRAAPLAFHHHHYDAAAFFARQERCGAMADLLYEKHPELKKWLSIRPVEWMRIDLAGAGPGRRARVTRVAGDLRLWERRALNLASWLDHQPGAAADDLLAPLFRYAFFKGLCGAMYGREPAEQVCAALFLGLVPAGVERMAEKAAREGLHLPGADVGEILGLI